MASTSVGASASTVLSGRFAVAVGAVSELGDRAVATILGEKVLKLGGQFFAGVSIQVIKLIVKDILMIATLGPIEPLLDLKLRRVIDVSRQVLGVGQHFAEAKDVMMHVSVTAFLPSLHELAINRIARIGESQELGHVCWDGIFLESG